MISFEIAYVYIYIYIYYIVCINNCIICETETYCLTCLPGFNLVIDGPDDGICMIGCPTSKLYYDDLIGNCRCNLII